MTVAELAPTQAKQHVSGEFHQMSFTGSGKEYFGIWIVNILLTILTLGIYSAWAKVRRNRYFFGNTILLGRTFEYHAKGRQILIGRLIVIGALVAVNLVAVFVPALVFLPTIAFLIALPWLLVKGLRFNARVTSYRNVRFDFDGRPAGAIKPFIVGGLLTLITLGLLAPLASRWVGAYVGTNLRFGGKVFETKPPLLPLYQGLFLGLGLGLAVGVLVMAIVMGALRFSGMLYDVDQGPATFITLTITSYVVLLSILVVSGVFYRAAVRNVVWRASTFDDTHRFRSSISRGHYTWIAISNTIVTILSLGMMRPWAAVRMARYTWERTGVVIAGNVGTLISEVEEQVSAAGAEFIEYEDFDFGF